jgi:hypothetical protein
MLMNGKSGISLQFLTDLTSLFICTYNNHRELSIVPKNYRVITGVRVSGQLLNLK